jgi:hypothetical protein
MPEGGSRCQRRRDTEDEGRPECPWRATTDCPFQGVGVAPENRGMAPPDEEANAPVAHTGGGVPHAGHDRTPDHTPVGPGQVETRFIQQLPGIDLALTLLLKPLPLLPLILFRWTTESARSSAAETACSCTVSARTAMPAGRPYSCLTAEPSPSVPPAPIPRSMVGDRLTNARAAPVHRGSSPGTTGTDAGSASFRRYRCALPCAEAAEPQGCEEVCSVERGTGGDRDLKMGVRLGGRPPLPNRSLFTSVG